MKITANEIRVGFILEINNNNYIVREIIHVKPGKGGAFVQTDLKHVLNDQNLHIKFRSEEKVERIQIYEKPGLFLYKDKNRFVFLDNESFEEKLVDSVKHEAFFTEGCEVVLLIDSDNQLITVNLPSFVTCEVDLTTGYISGQSASSQEKNATLTNGEIIKVPQYIKTGDKIKINTKNFTFESRI